MGEAREIPGRGSRTFALRGLLQFRKLIYSKALSWPEAQAAKLGAPIFFSDLIIPTVVVTDPTTVAHIFTTPKDVCDRLGNLGFGPLVLRPRIIGPIQPALVARAKENARSRRFIDAALKDALPRFNQVLASTVNEIAGDWASSGTVPFTTLNGIGSKVMARWLMDIDLDAEEAAKWPKIAVHLKTSSKLLNSGLDFFTGPGKSGIQTADRIFETFRTAPRADHIRGIAKETGLDSEEALRHLAFIILFNTAGLSTLISQTLAQLAVTPDWAAAIRDELGDRQLTLEGMDELPILRKVFVEASRLFSGPPALYRKAIRSFDLPCGDGNTYRVKKGDTLLLSKRCIHHNKMFTQPLAFNPERFDKEPDLLSYVFIFGPHESPYRCAASDSGFSATLYMYLLGRLLQGWDWQLSHSPTVNPDIGSYYAPSNLALVQFRARD